MNAVAGAIEKIASHTQESVNPVREGDWTGEDGLLYCGKCGGKKQVRVTLLGRTRIVPCVCPCREEEFRKEDERAAAEEKMRAVERLRSVSLMSPKLQSAVFEAYQVRPENEKAYRIARNYVDQFARMEQEGQGLMFYGPIGTGKSFTAACIANALLSRGVPAVMTSFVRILNSSLDDRSIENAAESASLLVIDDLGAERSTDYALERVYNIIDSRVRSGKPMILTTNLTMAEMKRPADIRYSRVYDRVFETCYPVQITGRSFRLDEGNRRFSSMRKLLEEER